MRKANWFPSFKTKRKAEKINSEANTDYIDVDLEIDPSLISICDVIGHGRFNNAIYRGVCEGIGPVAIKVLPPEFMIEREEFFEETILWKEINHPNIVKLLGVCSHGPMYIISELMEKGKLWKNLVDNKPSMSDMISIAIQVSRGMNYLASQDLVLRYLTVRNVFVSGDWNVKIGSLWMCRKLVDGVYIEKDDWPYSTVSPEATHKGRFSTKSDVWSFGILLVDMVKVCPGFYFEVDANKTVRNVYVTPKGENVPPEMQPIISVCCREKPDDRPNFVEIEKKLQDVLEKELYGQVGDAIYNEAYYRALEKGEAVNNRIPIMLVGQDRTGKTSLKKHLLGLPFDVREPSTNGIEVDMVELTDENAEEPWKRKEVAQFMISEEEATEQVVKQAACLLTQRESEPEKEEEIAKPFPQSHATKQVPPTSGNFQELAQGDNSTPPTSRKSPIEALPKALVDDIRSFEKKVGIDETPPVRAIVHDFAGQNVFHDTHYYFLKLQCPYIVVHDLRNPLLDPAQPRFKPKGIDVERNLNNPLLATNLDNFLSWLTVLDTLRDSTGKVMEKFSSFKLPPVLIALTNSDRFEGDIDEVKEKIEDILTERGFENVFIEPYVINNTSSGFTKDDVRKLRRKLYELCKTILGKQRPVPVRWLQFEASLSKKMVEEKIPYISVAESRKIGEDCKVEDVDAALTFLHHQGVVVHHRGSSVVVLNPVWLMNLFAEVISLPRVDNPSDTRYRKLMKKGILMQEYLREREHGELLEEFMLQFGLICRWQHERSPAFIVPSVAPVMEKGKDVEEQLSSSPIAPLFFRFKRGYMLPGIFTRFLVKVMEKLREFLQHQRPNLYCNYTLLSLQVRQGECDVYVIEQLAGIKIGVVPRCSVDQRECRKIALYLKKVMTECIEGIKDEKKVYYGDIDVSLFVKCSACSGETGQCLRHGNEHCDRDDCGHFWSLDDLWRHTEDPVCDVGSVVGTRKFPLERVKPWMGLDLDLDLRAQQEICKRLDFLQEVGGDFRELAGHFDMPCDDLDLIAQQSEPTYKVLRWAARKPCNTIAKLREIFVKMGRWDCVGIIDMCREPEN